VDSDEKYIMDKGEIIVGVETNKPPMSYYNDYGKLTGFDIEFAEVVALKLGLDIVFKEIDWNEKEDELNSKNIDCIWSSMTVTEERRKIFEFSRVYINNRQVVVIRREDASKFPDAESFIHAKMAAGSSTTGEEALLGDPYLSQSDYTNMASQNDAVVALKNGECDGIVIDYTLAKGHISDDDSELMVVDGIRLEEEQYAVGFRYGSDMAKRINDIFLDMILDGTLTVLANKYNLFELYEPLETTDAEYIINNGKMVIGIEDNIPPYSYYDKNGELTGFEIEFAKAVCEKLGIDAEFKPTYWNKKEIELKKRNIDCIWSSLSVSEDRRSNIKFSRVYMSNRQVIIIKKSNASKYTNLQNFIESKVSALIKSSGEETIKNDLNLSKANYISFETMDEVIKALNKEEVDAVVVDYTIAQDYISNGYHDLMIIKEIIFDSEMYAVGFRVGSDMTIKINEQINNMIEDGTLESLTKKYGLDELYNIAITPDENSDLNYIMSKGEMIIGIDENTPPMSYYDNDGELIGFNIEMAKAICLNLGIDV